jgi:hypothetical protein
LHDAHFSNAREMRDGIGGCAIGAL